jgi:hypothetical protein
MQNLKAFIGCEYSGMVSHSFLKLGWKVVSCDLAPSELTQTENYTHYQMDLLDCMDLFEKNSFDIAIFFPPCTYLSSAGLHFCQIKKYKSKAVRRIAKRASAIRFFFKCYNTHLSDNVCVENPVGYINKHVLKQSQCIHPYYFGDREMKRTCLWLKNLPKLVHQAQDDLFSKATHSEKPIPIASKIVNGKVKNRYFLDKFEFFLTRLKHGKDESRRQKSKFWQGIADAMAQQWTRHIKRKLNRQSNDAFNKNGNGI